MHAAGGEQDESCLHAKDKTWRGPRWGLTDPGTDTLVTSGRSEYLHSSILLDEDICQLIFVLAILTACFG